MSHKDFVIKKIEGLMSYLEKTYDPLEEWTIPDDYLEVVDILQNAQSSGHLDSTKLRRLNYIYRKTAAVEKMIKDFGRTMTYEEWVEWNIVDVLKNNKKDDKIQQAIYYVVLNNVKKDGTSYTPEEARDFVEQIRKKYSINV